LTPENQDKTSSKCYGLAFSECTCVAMLRINVILSNPYKKLWGL
jgi:hypothetical protein